MLWSNWATNGIPKWEHIGIWVGMGGGKIARAAGKVAEIQPFVYLTPAINVSYF